MQLSLAGLISDMFWKQNLKKKCLKHKVIQRESYEEMILGYNFAVGATFHPFPSPHPLHLPGIALLYTRNVRQQHFKSDFVFILCKALEILLKFLFAFCQ